MCLVFTVGLMKGYGLIMLTRRGRYKLEILSNLEEINSLHSQGMSIPSIYKKLFNDGKITMAYHTFYCRFKNKDDGKKENPEGKKRKKSNSNAREEIINNKDEIIELLNKGYLMLDVYRHLKAEGKFNYGLTSFYVISKSLEIKNVNISSID